METHKKKFHDSSHPSGRLWSPPRTGDALQVAHRTIHAALLSAALPYDWCVASG